MRRSNVILRKLMRNQEGFTLVEVLVTMLMMITVMFALYSIFDMSLRVFSFGNDKTEAVQNARAGLERMERELRGAYPVDKASGEDHLFFASGSPSTESFPGDDNITFGNDLNGDREIDLIVEPAEEINYQLSGDSPPALLRNGQPLAEFAQTGGLTFTYCKSINECPPSSPIPEEDIKIVRIELEVAVDRGASGPVTQTLTTDVTLRNRTR